MNNNQINFNRNYEKDNYLPYNNKTKIRIENFINFIKKYKVGGKLADVCCGNKYIGIKFNSDFFDYFPIDDEVKFNNLNYNHYIGKYDNIIFSHALEHFENIEIILKRLISYLNVKGRLFLAFPNGEYINSNYQPLDIFRGHLSCITIDLILKILNNMNNIKVVSFELKKGGIFNGYEEIYIVVEKQFEELIIKEKIYLEYEEFKYICLLMAKRIEKINIDQIVAISRGGISAAHIISKYLKKDVGYFIPKNNELILNHDVRNIVFIEDLVAKGRTYNLIKEKMKNSLIKNWLFCPVLVDSNYKENDFKIYGFKSNDWIVFPYEEISKMNIDDRGLFRENTDNYGD
jgi:hypoxanthine phosphoribosyltransferase